jgi:hypothetical protein
VNDRIGGSLVAAVEAEADRRSLSVRDLGPAFGLSHVYWRAVVCGQRSASRLGRPALKKIAGFLNTSLVHVLRLAEVISPLDFISPSVSRQLEGSYPVLAGQSWMGGVLPSEKSWEETPLDVKMVVLRMCERLSGGALIDGSSVSAVQRLGDVSTAKSGGVYLGNR